VRRDIKGFREKPYAGEKICEEMQQFRRMAIDRKTVMLYNRHYVI